MEILISNSILDVEINCHTSKRTETAVAIRSHVDQMFGTIYNFEHGWEDNGEQKFDFI